jgi:hypothetical protein
VWADFAGTIGKVVDSSGTGINGASLKEAIRRGQIVTVHRGSDGTHPTLVVEKVEDPADAGSSLTLDALKDVAAPANTPTGKLLGTTAAGQWGPVDPPASTGAGNLLTPNQASGTDTLGTVEGFSPVNADLTSVPGTVQGSKALRATCVTIVARWGVVIAGTGSGSSDTAGTGTVPVRAGATYTATCTVSGTGLSQFKFRLSWWAADGSTPVGTAAETAQAVVTALPVERTLTATAPPGAAYASLRLIRVAGGAVGDTLEVDRVGLWEGPGGTWAMPGGQILNLGIRVTRPNGTDRLVEVMRDGSWVIVTYDSGTRDVAGSKLRRIGSTVFKTGTPALTAGFQDTWATGATVFPTDDPVPTSLPGTLVTTAP